MNKSSWIMLYVLCLALALHKDYKKHLLSQEIVEVRSWICSKTHPQRTYRSMKWNTTLFQLPGITTTPYIPIKPIEAAFEWSDRIEIPYSEDALAMKLVPRWDNKDDCVCMYVDELPSICNIFRGCWYWGAIVPLKAAFHILRIDIHDIKHA